MLNPFNHLQSWSFEKGNEKLSMMVEKEKWSWAFLVVYSGSWEDGIEEHEVEKLLLGSRESNEEEWVLEGEHRSLLELEEKVSFLLFSQVEIEGLGEWGDNPMAARKDLDPRFLLKNTWY